MEQVLEFRHGIRNGIGHGLGEQVEQDHCVDRSILVNGAAKARCHGNVDAVEPPVARRQAFERQVWCAPRLFRKYCASMYIDVAR